MKVLKFTGAVLATVIILAAVLFIVGVPAGLLTSAIGARVERETGYRLTIAGAARFGLWPQFNVILNDVTLRDPKARDAESTLNVGSIRADVILDGLWRGDLEITEITMVHPVLHLPLLRQRTQEFNPPAKLPAAAAEPDTGAPAFDHIIVTDGIIVFSNLRDRVENRIEGINADFVIDAARKVAISGSARAGEHPLQFKIGATIPVPPVARQNIPVELMLDTSGLLQAPLTAKAEARLSGQVLMLNGVSGTIGDGAFNGWASVDLSSKPLLKLDLDFQRLGLSASNAVASSGSPQPWSRAPIDLIGLNYLDLQAKVSAAELTIGAAHLAPISIDAGLAGGVLKVRFANLGAYGGQANGDLTLDASAASPVYALTGDLVGVRALPLLQSLAGFDKLDGKLRAKIAVHSSGASQYAILSNLGGTVFALFQDGAIRGLNVAQMIRSLTSGPLSGWQQSGERSTDLSQLSASFRIENGQATTSDLNLVGPLVLVTGAGTVEIPAQTLALRIEPRLVLTTEGQGRASDPVGLGIPVAVDGPWAEPRIYPDVSGILDNPEAAYARLKEMGNGLFGNDGGLGALGNQSGNGTAGGNLSDQLGETLGNLLQQGLRQSRSMPATANSPPATPDDTAPPEPQPKESQPMNDLLRQLFNR